MASNGETDRKNKGNLLFFYKSYNIDEYNKKKLKKCTVTVTRENINPGYAYSSD